MNAGHRSRTLPSPPPRRANPTTLRASRLPLAPDGRRGPTSPRRSRPRSAAACRPRYRSRRVDQGESLGGAAGDVRRRRRPADPVQPAVRGPREPDPRRGGLAHRPVGAVRALHRAVGPGADRPGRPLDHLPRSGEPGVAHRPHDAPRGRGPGDAHLPRAGAAARARRRHRRDRRRSARDAARHRQPRQRRRPLPRLRRPPQGGGRPRAAGRVLRGRPDPLADPPVPPPRPGERVRSR